MRTIKDIAKLAGVSRTTVSRVLNNSGYISEKSRKKVMDVIEETGYVPSQHAKSLRTKQTKIIGVILPKISTDTSSRTVDGMNEVFGEKGYQILLTSTNLDKEKEIEHLRLLQNRQVDGIILLATNTDEDLVEEIRKSKVPVVVIGQEVAGDSEIPSVIFDDYGASASLMETLIDNGYRKIGYIGVESSDRAVGVLRKQAYIDAMEKHNLEIGETWIQTGDFSIDSGYEAARRIFEGSRNVDAVFAATDRMGIGAFKYLRKERLSIPEDVAVVGIGSSETSRFIDPAMTTVEYEFEEAGRTGAEILLDILNGEANVPVKKLLDFKLVSRDSL
ncbi:LacI family DNA-binding transcriptional regulator [Salinicoccus halodurans]|uniref:DNA-binding protein n=1 Tax=Salinicoccus halodurans TaxID=407035 RepID=A0A0F7HN87_9STAP|nr:LacI family DNA-binding transcriptional regulator [Salinicoccus halodurans]AKG74598.1 DNA-binding protein [Salinicoccus halodurans]SFK89394.1 transcriptional regulator, LacI family [Salinicoccus halodurans]